MQLSWKFAVLGTICALGLCGAFSQDSFQGTLNDKPDSAAILQPAASKQKQSDERERLLNQNDRLSLLAAALDRRVWRNAEGDCSHLVHAIYEDAGFSYPYAPSSELYAGVEGFQRVKSAEPGDLVVWRGHVGIVIKPSEHIFFSYMSSGPGTDDYQGPYWKRRGHPRFYRYVKNTFCEKCESSTHVR
jgi:NlpC/P60 family